jgi:hypothetical protein
MKTGLAGARENCTFVPGRAYFRDVTVLRFGDTQCFL